MKLFLVGQIVLIKSGPDFKRMCNFIEDPAQRLHTTFN